MNGYIKFNVQGLTGTIKIATLRVYSSKSSRPGYEVRNVADSTRGEKTISYSNAPAMPSTVTASLGGFATDVWTSVNVTPLVSGDGTYSFG